MGGGERKKGVPYSGEMSERTVQLFSDVGQAESDFGGRVMAGGYSEADRATGVCSTGGVCSSDIGAGVAAAKEAAADLGAGAPSQIGGRRRNRKTRRKQRGRRSQRGGRRSSQRRSSQRRSSQRRSSSQKPFFLKVRLSGGISLKQRQRH